MKLKKTYSLFKFLNNSLFAPNPKYFGRFFYKYGSAKVNNLNPEKNKEDLRLENAEEEINAKMEANEEGFLNKIEEYENNQDDSREQYKRKYQIIDGYATPKGTSTYMKRAMTKNVAKTHFRVPYGSGVHISSIGIGSYMGDPTDLVDFDMYNAIKQSVLSGAVNHIDTAINYRYMKSERTIREVINTLQTKYAIGREELFIASKIGFIPEDADNGISGKVLIRDLVNNNEIEETDVVHDVHCMHPAYLQHQLRLSLSNLGLNTLDLLYLHNPYEIHGPGVKNDDIVFDRLAKAFEFLESQVANGKIRKYGIASYICFRSPPSEKYIHLSLQKIVKLAEEVGGKYHNMRYIQVPINLMAPEAFVEKWQPYESEINNQKTKTNEFLLSVARMLEINVVGSQPLLQGKLRELPVNIGTGVTDIGARHLQLMRSIPAKCLLSTLVGMNSMRDVRSNIKVAQIDPLDKQDFFRYLMAKHRKPFVEDKDILNN